MKMEDAKDKEVEKIAKLIESYINRHPNASDSMEGIAKWWIPRMQEYTQTERVLLALDILISKNVLKRIKDVNGQVNYKSSNE